MKLQEKTIVVTGASSGIGAATALALAGGGARVVLVARGVEGLDRQVATVKAMGGDALALAADLSDPVQIAELGERIRSTVGVPDVLVNNAGAGRFTYLHHTEPDELLAMAHLPFLAAMLLTREFLPGMLERGSGRIVIVNSPVSRMPWAGSTGYLASRFALRGLTAGLRQDLAGTGVGVSEVIPGKVSSDYFANNPGAEQRIPRLARIIPTLTPEQAADAVVLAIEKERAEVLAPWQLRAFALSAQLAPGLTGVLTNVGRTHRP